MLKPVPDCSFLQLANRTWIDARSEVRDSTHLTS